MKTHMPQDGAVCASMSRAAPGLLLNSICVPLPDVRLLGM